MRRLTVEEDQQLEEIYGKVRRAVRRMTHTEQIVDDITQGVFASLVEKICEGKEIASPLGYAIGIARNDVRSYYKDLRRGQLPSESIHQDFEDCAPWPYAESEHDPTAGLQYLNLIGEVRSAIGDEEEARIYEMTHVWDLKGYEIAEIMGISPAGVSRKLRRATEKASRLRQDLGTE